MANQYALPARVAVLGASYEEAREYIARRKREFEEQGLEPVAVSAAGHPGSAAGMVLARLMVTAKAHSAPHFDEIRALLQHGVVRGRNYFNQDGEQ